MINVSAIFFGTFAHRAFAMLMLAGSFLFAMAGCGGGDAQPPEADETFTVMCEKFGPPGSAPGGIASHNFGTTNPATLARVAAFETTIPNVDDRGPDGGSTNGESFDPRFQGSLAIVYCEPDTSVTFVLLP